MLLQRIYALSHLPDTRMFLLVNAFNTGHRFAGMNQL